ncbi:potassium channel family protein [Diplocloster agilis]|uniref:TrkA family potassium uptake protein n=1 Tax=Diplocloster agilis TaxID=2850323 RepID=A0A949JUA6_9FIRM|nr:MULTISPECIES: TrkA family potassium uptake protein [Lachnospiraceae]MBU9735245.1 TrkA family potassium uptake protein [Diplocloster agilis]MBU9743644.1 TrkA family potassium uptake protein [Diplocloster agilis]MCU6733790.1 TrkA family potassium uptake protein [Suonthocola fibrivorans]SCJ09110.1 Ktr system potassium uptake protein A [uncultured Clostridium sp.]
MKGKETYSYGIIGLGRFGTALAKTLSEAGKEVVVIDHMECKVRELRQYTENAFVSEDLSKEVLEEIGIQNCDTVIVCIGEKIDTSILTTLNVVSLGVPRVIAKAISPEQGEVLEKIGAEVVYPERDMALRLAKRLLTNNILDYINLNNDVEITEISITQAVEGKTVLELDLRKTYGLNIIAVEHDRLTDTEIGPDYRFQRGDIIVVIGKTQNVKRFEQYLS